MTLNRECETRALRQAIRNALLALQELDQMLADGELTRETGANGSKQLTPHTIGAFARRHGEQALAALMYVNTEERVTPAMLAEHLGIDPRVASALLGRLARSGDVAHLRRGLFGPSGRYSAGDDDGEASRCTTIPKHQVPQGETR